MFTGENNMSLEYIKSNRYHNIETNRHKYIVIDSQADQQYYYSQLQHCHNCNINPIHIPHQYTLNSTAYHRQEQQFNQAVINQLIVNTQKQLYKLQSQCQLLQKIINDMIKQEVNLIVESRKQQRSQSIHKQNYNSSKPCPIHRNRISSVNKHKKINIQNPLIDLAKDKINYTSLLSLTIQKQLYNNLEPLKTKQINIKNKFQQENITPKKKKIKECCSTIKNSNRSKKGSSIKEVKC